MAADRDDRSGNNEGGGVGFVMGLLAGAALGAGLGLLFAPKAGVKLRRQLSRRAGALADQAQERYRSAAANAAEWADTGKETAGEWVDTGKDMYGKAREAVSRGADEAQTYIRDAVDAVTGPSRRS